MISATAYDAIAEWYDATIRAGGLLHEVVLSTLYELLGAVVGPRICDLACGQGLVARHLAEHGASVIAVNISRELLKIAQRYPDNRARPIGYVQGDAQALPLQAASFDGIVCNMALMDIPDLALMLRTVAGLLRPEGWFVFSITHPCLEISRSQPRWMGDPTGLPEVNSYFVEGPWRSDNPEGVRGRVSVGCIGIWGRDKKCFNNGR